MTIGFAHRGARLEHPDNTLDGFARALALGAQALETDAWVTADGVAVLDHDGVVGRLRRTPVRSVPRAALPAHVPTLGELYDLIGGRAVDVSIDVKDPAAWPAVLDAAAAAAADRRRLWLCSASLDELAAQRRGDAEVRLVHSTRPDRLHGDVADHARALADAGVDALNMRAPAWTSERVAACHGAGVAAFGWDAQRREVLEGLLAMGIDAVYSDHVAVMVDVLALRSP